MYKTFINFSTFINLQKKIKIYITSIYSNVLIQAIQQIFMDGKLLCKIKELFVYSLETHKQINKRLNLKYL